ncbi:MAG: PrsW family glutamic-type intramembrane protease [Clostridia bacterium]|nr:PrsW family glutamic-type intramembrane protease [Clostridia bacterium]
MTGYIRAGVAVRRFFAETFRCHGKTEYEEIFTRGLRRKKGTNTVYPWLYIRFFVILFAIFTLFLVTMYCFGNILLYPSAVAFGGICFALPFILLIYELYPKKDLSVVRLLGIVVVGGLLSIVLALALYYVLPEPEGWLDAFEVGCVEEFSKAVVAILIIIAMKTKNPFLGFVVGAAVGAGFSVIEDTGYIFAYSSNSVVISGREIVDLFVSRGISTFCTHILWTGLIAWAYTRRKNILNWSLTFAGTCVLSVALHMLWDAPVYGVGGSLLCAACGICAGALSVAVAVTEWRKEGIRRDGVSERPFGTSAEQLPPYFRQGAKISSSLALVLVCICALIYVFLPVYVGYGMATFSDPENFVAYAQWYYDLDANPEREFDAAAGADTKIDIMIGDVTYTYVTQTEFAESEEIEETSYLYTYCYRQEEGGYTLTDIYVDISEGGNTCHGEYVTVLWQGEEYFGYFAVSPYISGVIVEDDGTVVATLYDDAFVYAPDYYSPKGTLPTLCVAASIVVCDVVVLIVLYSKARKKKKNEGERDCKCDCK